MNGRWRHLVIIIIITLLSPRPYCALLARPHTFQTTYALVIIYYLFIYLCSFELSIFDGMIRGLIIHSDLRNVQDIF